MPTDEPSPAAVELAVLVPIFGHVALAMEALHSARAQGGVDLHIVCIVDGDPDPSLARLLTSFAAAPGHPCSVYWRRNGGLSAARNSAIEVALRRFPALEAVFFLDADNRLGPDAFGPALRRIREDEADILYPDLVNFGLRSSQDTAGKFSQAALLRGNYIEAGSLVAARVLRAGLRFDETLREGYEDWAFWLQAVRAGFRFAHEGRLGLRYRRRPESMLANTGRHAPRLRAAIEAANPDLFSRAGRARIEARDEPRFALVHVDTGRVEFSSDPGRAAEQIDATACGRRLALHRAAPAWAHFPAFVCLATGETIAKLRGDGLLPGLLWRLVAEGGAGAACHLAADRGKGVELTPAKTEAAHLLVMPRSVLCDADRGLSRDDHLARFTLRVPADRPAPSEGIESAAYGILKSWGETDLAASAAIAWTWRGAVAPRLPVKPIGDPFPLVPAGCRHIAMVHADAAGGGAPDLRASAEAFATAGYIPHLLAQGAVPADVLNAFSTTTLLPTEPARRPPSTASDRSFHGAPIDRPEGHALAAFDWLDAIVVLAVREALPLLGALRGRGIVTIVVCEDAGGEQRLPLRRDSDLPYLLAAYEHAIDAFVAGRDAATWLTALGIPRSKIVASDASPPAHTLVATVERCLETRDRKRAGVA